MTQAVLAERGSFALDRRSFLRSGTAGLVVSFTVGFSGHEAIAGTGAMVGAYIQIDPSNVVTVYIGATEMGQGIMTGMAQLVAEELALDWTTVRTEHAPAAAAYANPLFHAQVTGGSTSMRGWFTPLRKAAAVAREMLLTQGATYLGQPRSNCTVKNSAVWCGSTSVPFGTIAADAAKLTAPDPSTVSLNTTLTVIGQRLPRTDIPDKVTGAATFGIDVRVPGMVYAAVQHCPTLGGTVQTMPSKPGGALAVVNLGNAVGVVANDTWTAMNLANGLKVTWAIPASSASIDSAAILAQAQTLMSSGTPQVIETSGDAVTALAGSTNKIDATYQLPFLAHACMEVLNCTASVTPTSCEIWAPTQAQGYCLATAQALTSLPATAITIHTTFLGGGLGRKIEQDYISQAIKISQAVGKPVKLTWSRTQDFQHDMYRPCSLIRVQAGLDASGNIASLVYRNVAPSISAQRSTTPGSNPEDTGAVAGATGLAYSIGARQIEFVPNPTSVPLGYWRSVGESYNTFAVESSIDQLAALAGQDPLAFRKTLLAGNTRALAVLDAVASISNRASPPPAGTARGLAFLIGFGSIIAEVAEVTKTSAGVVKVNKVYCAIDCGTAVNPDAIEAQMQGGVAHGLSATLWGQVTFAAGKANVTNFSNYRLLRRSEMPQVITKIVPSAGPIGGIGETAVPCVAPAVANAYAKLTGTRVSVLPFYPGSTMGGG